MLVMVIDRRWKTAAIWSLVAALLACCGIIHVPEAGFENFSQPTWEQCVSYPDDCWQYAEQWMFFISYIMFFVTFGLIELSRKYGCDPTLLPPLEDETTHAFDNWFENAAVAGHMHTHKPTEQVDEPIYDKSTMFKPDKEFVDVTDSTVQSKSFKVEEGAVESLPMEKEIDISPKEAPVDDEDEEFGA